MLSHTYQALRILKSDACLYTNLVQHKFTEVINTENERSLSEIFLQ